MALTPQAIYEDYIHKVLNKHSAIEQLTNLIENSENLQFRINGIKFLGEIDNTIEIFKLLENLLISDSYEEVRNASAELLKEKFLDKSLEPMKWALNHESSPNCLKTIHETLVSIVKNLEKENNPTSKSFLIQEVKKIDDKDFKIGFETLSQVKKESEIATKELTDILISYYTITFLKKIFWRLKYTLNNCQVVEIDFLFKGLTKIPDALKYLTSLKSLILRYNQITNLPEWIGSLKALESLILNVNNITEVPASIGGLSSLKELSLWKNELSYLPKSIETLNSLKILNLRLNQLKELPNTIGNLRALKELNLHDNKLINLPITIGSLISLEKLNASWNNLSEIPDSIRHLSSLKKLDLARNELIFIPESIGSLNALEILNLSENKLKKIPTSICNLASLKYLNLSRNELTFLPESIDSLTSLKELYLGENKFEKLPSKALKNLENSGVQIY